MNPEAEAALERLARRLDLPSAPMEARLRAANRRYWIGWTLHYARIYTSLGVTFAIATGLAVWVGLMMMPVWDLVPLPSAIAVIGSIIVGMVVWVLSWSLLLALTRRVYE